MSTSRGELGGRYHDGNGHEMVGKFWIIECPVGGTPLELTTVEHDPNAPSGYYPMALNGKTLQPGDRVCGLFTRIAKSAGDIRAYLR